MRAAKIQIPATIEEAITALGGLGKLLTAKGWERAAIVYAFTEEPGPGPRHRDLSKATKLSVTEFAALGIHGLTGTNAVYFHRRNWQAAIDSGEAVAAQAGELVTLPTSDYPPSAHDSIGEQVKISAPVEANVTAIRRLMEEKPEVAKAIERDFVEKVATSPRLKIAVDRKWEASHPNPEKPEKPAHLAGVLTLVQFCGEIDAYVDTKRGDLTRLREYIHAAGMLSDLDRQSIMQGIEALDQARANLGLYQRVIRAEMGMTEESDLSRIFAADQERTTS